MKNNEQICKCFDCGNKITTIDIAHKSKALGATEIQICYKCRTNKNLSNEQRTTIR